MSALLLPLGLRPKEQHVGRFSSHKGRRDPSFDSTFFGASHRGHYDCITLCAICQIAKIDKIAHTRRFIRSGPLPPPHLLLLIPHIQGALARKQDISSMHITGEAQSSLCRMIPDECVGQQASAIAAPLRRCALEEGALFHGDGHSSSPSSLFPPLSRGRRSISRLMRSPSPNPQSMSAWPRMLMMKWKAIM